MRSLLIIFATLAISVAVSAVDTTPKNKLEADILNLLTNWRAGATGPFSFPLPSLDQIILPDVNGNYEGFGAKISYTTSELKLSGLKNFQVEALDASKSNLKASTKITVPSLTIIADKYDIKGRALWFVPVSGSGRLRLTSRNNTVTFSIKLRTNGTSTWVDSLQLAFTVGNIQAKLSNGPAAINTILNSSGTQVLRSNHDDIVTVVRGQMVPVINQFLQGMAPDQLFQTIAQGAGPNADAA